jgi:hypothetical protein
MEIKVKEKIIRVKRAIAIMNSPVCMGQHVFYTNYHHENQEAAIKDGRLTKEKHIYGIGAPVLSLGWQLNRDTAGSSDFWQDAAATNIFFNRHLGVKY